MNDTTPADEQREPTPARPANPRVVELIDYVVRQRSVLLAAVSAVPEAERDIPVTPGAWSVAGVLEHLHRVETGIARLLVRSVERARASGLGAESESSSLLGSLDSFGLVQRGRRMEAPGPVLPRGEYNASQALMALAASRNALLAAVRKGMAWPWARSLSPTRYWARSTCISGCSLSDNMRRGTRTRSRGSAGRSEEPDPGFLCRARGARPLAGLAPFIVPGSQRWIVYRVLEPA